MIFERVGCTTIVSHEDISLASFIKLLEKAYEKIAEDNLIINLTSFHELTPVEVLDFSTVSEQHQNCGKSFVLVSTKIAYDDVPDTLNLVPTLQEAHDIIEMEEIERDLGI